ncbi:MAG: 3-deoxy-D-manno-octulosonic acid transferase [Cyclobacteriaceae bacterium]|nr:3-deoxy-D-manno-octulosonic acid transferase [Cyclobacteriaceae bacterium]
MYSIIIFLASAFVRLTALFNAKSKLFVEGRKGIFARLSRAFENNTHPVLWIHCASLGEFEQGRPIIESFKREFSNYQVLLTFFSPSGYEVRKNYEFANHIFYLPWDTRGNAKRFVDIVKPAIAIFIKYEFWHYYSRTLSAKGIPVLSVSSIFREQQAFFKFYGSKQRKTLSYFNYFFVQNDESRKLLSFIGITNATVAGDTRFDRVNQIVSQRKEIDVAKNFKASDNVFVVGSAWSEDMEVLAPAIIEKKGNLKFIIAPHEIHESSIVAIEKALEVRTIRYSKAVSTTDLKSFDVLIIDNMGMLSSLYQYGEYAYVGGAFGKGLHNILEAACYGIPIFFGNKNYKKFKEATDLIMRGGAFEVGDYADFKTKLESLTNRPENYLLASEVTRSYVTENLGATRKVMDYCHKILDR